MERARIAQANKQNPGDKYMKLIDLYSRILETTGLDVMTLGSLQAAVYNCMADLTSRGYKSFKEIKLSDLIEEDKKYIELQERMGQPVDTNILNVLQVDDTTLKFRLPKDLRKTLYCKLYFNTQATKATRYSVSNPRIECDFYNGKFHTKFDSKSNSIFYNKNDIVHIEWKRELGPIVDVQYGYYQKLSAPMLPTDVEDAEAMRMTEIDIRPEFEDALVLYACYFYYSRFIKDTDKIQLYQNQYKYYVEDIIHELSYEDEFFEEDTVITTDDEE